MQIERQYKRIEVELPVTITTVLDANDASIVDLTEGGAQVAGYSVAEGTRFQIEYMGQTLYAQCRWAEIDRMGVKFLFPLTDGPLYERLMVARASHLYGDAATGTSIAMAPLGGGHAAPGARMFGRAVGSFGRRA